MAKGVTRELNELMVKGSKFSLVHSIASRAKEIMNETHYNPEAKEEKTNIVAISEAIKEEYTKKNPE